MTVAKPSLSLMGTLAIRLDRQRQRLPFAGNTRRLFTVLAGHANHALRRDHVLDTIWPNSPTTRSGSALNTAVWRIKHVLSRYPGFTLEIIDDTLRLSVEAPACVDAHELETSVRTAGVGDGGAALTAQQRERLLDALAECRGEFLEGCTEHWTLALREHYSALHVRAMAIIMRDAARAGDYETALLHGRKILEIDPFREGTQREVMWLYALNGQRAQAVRQFESLKNLLRKELSIAPMPETQSLFNRIVEARQQLSAGLETARNPNWQTDGEPSQAGFDVRERGRN
jgi:DNA-binding SARP family transcriptional activator